MAHDIDSHLIERWLAGETTPAEEAAVRAWLAADPRNRVFLETLRERLPVREPAADDWDVERAWSRAAKATGVAPPPLDPPIRIVPPTPKRRPSIPLRWLARAAVLALMLGGGLVVHQVADRRPSTAVAPAPREFTTARGQRIEVRFPDGTNATLGPMSRLVIPHDYGADERRIRLDGEAYFDVVHNEARPFVVQARHAVARDLGTRFTVRAREGEADVRVVVTEGKVVLSAGTGSGSGAILGVRDLGRVDTTGTPRVTRGVDVDRYLSWMRGQLAFDQTPLPDAVAELGRWYDVQVSLGDAVLRTRRLTITFGDESLDQILDAIAFITHARYERSGERVTFYSLQSTR